MTPLSPLGRLDTRRRHALVMLLVLMVVATPLALEVLKLKLQPVLLHLVVLLLRSSFPALVMCPLLILLRNPLIKKEGLLLKMSAP